MSRKPALLVLSLLVHLTVLSGCEDGADPYAACETNGDCSMLRDAGLALCLSLADVKVCTWHCETHRDCESDEGIVRKCSPKVVGGVGNLCLPACATRDDAGTSCPNGYQCQAIGEGDEVQELCIPK